MACEKLHSCASPEFACEFGSFGAGCELPSIELRNLVASLCLQGGISWKPLHGSVLRLLGASGRGGGMLGGCHRARKLFYFSIGSHIPVAAGIMMSPKVER